MTLHRRCLDAGFGGITSYSPPFLSRADTVGLRHCQELWRLVESRSPSPISSLLVNKQVLV